MTKIFKLAALFIGTIIGAGFATGKEIALYFGSVSPVAAALSGIFMGALMALFMLSGKYGFSVSGKGAKIAVYISSAITASAMIAAIESLFYNFLGLPLMGLLFALIGAVIVAFGMDKVKLINFIMVPAIVVLIVLIFVKKGNYGASGGFSIFPPISYAALNILLAGFILSEEGKRSSEKEIALSSFIAGVFLAVMLYLLRCVVDGEQGNMPVLSSAQQSGLKWGAVALIFLAVFTTLLSALKMLNDVSEKINAFLNIKGKAPNVLLTLILSYPLSLFGFGNLVDFGYPAVSAMGIALIVFTLVNLFAKNCEKLSATPLPRRRRPRQSPPRKKRFCKSSKPRRCPPPLSDDNKGRPKSRAQA